ncbi:M20 family metallopeptidase [Paeniglutamicibacter gangotriensis]|uniref:M20 family metallopeptidase n=1 Tax=Paeniglutamicibacter gangotriensis TaxID=254787 RepID=UPI0037C9C197
MKIDVDALTALTIKLVDAGGENPGGTEAATVQVLVEQAVNLGLEVSTREVAPGRPNVFITLPGGTAPGLLFLGHSDVVPAGDGWDHDPFDARVEGDRLYGRGSTDMKGGLAAALTAMGLLRDAGELLAGPVTLVCTVDEEEHGAGIRDLVANGLEHEYAACVVAEPTDLETVIACRGDSYLEIEVAGRAAHSGRPGDGRNAINAAVRICNLITADQEKLTLHTDPLLGHGTWNVGMISGGRGTSMVAPDARLSLDRRLMPGEDTTVIREQLLEEISAAGIDTDGIEVTARTTMEMPGFRTDPDHPLVAAMLRSTEAAGVSSPVTGWTASCDGGFIARDLGIPALVFGPGGLNDQAHQSNESVSVVELVAAVRIFVLLARDLLGGEAS